MKDKDLNLGILPEDKALEVKWNIQEDILGFIIKIYDKPTNRRGLLAALSSVYDLLGLGAPFLLKCRLIIQRLCRNNLKWAEPIDDDTAQEWLKWRNNLMALDGKSIAKTLVVLSVVLYTISQMHVKVDMVSLVISDCLIKVVKYIASC